MLGSPIYLEARVKKGPIKRKAIHRKTHSFIADGIDEETPRLHDIHIAARDQDLKKLKQIIAKNPEKVNLPIESLGATTLMIACASGNETAVKVLVSKGADLNCADNDGNTAFTLAASTPIKKYLLEHGADENPSGMHDIHIAVLNRDLNTIEQILQSNPDKLNATDRYGCTALFLAAAYGYLDVVKFLVRRGANLNLAHNEGWNPLHQAAYNQHKAVVVYLIENGADPHLVTKGQLSIVNAAELKTGASTPLSEYLKRQIGFSRRELVLLGENFRTFFEDQIKLAKKNGKKVLFVLGETHGNYRIFQLQQHLLPILKNLGITIYLDEHSASFETDYPIVLLAKNKLGMKVVPIDNHRDREKVSVDERNIVMVKEILKLNKDAVFVPGVGHLKGFIQNPNSKIDNKRFHIVPVSLALVNKSFQANTLEEKFASSPKNVIQVVGTSLSDPKPVMAKWNPQSELSQKQSFTPLHDMQKKRKAAPAKTQTTSHNGERKIHSP